jgi:hypothetical protein
MTGKLYGEEPQPLQTAHSVRHPKSHEGETRTKRCTTLYDAFCSIQKHVRLCATVRCRDDEIVKWVELPHAGAWHIRPCEVKFTRSR